MPVLVLFLCLIGNYYTYHSKGDLVQVKEEIYSQGEFISTPVPNSGYVENVYFNTNLSVEEVVDLCSQLTFTNDVYFVISSDTFILQIGLVDGVVAIVDYLKTSVVFVSSDVGFGFVGWNPNLSNIFVVNAEVHSSFVVDDTTFDVGNQNDLISSLIGSSSFKYQDGELIRTEVNYLTFEEWFGEQYTIPAKSIEGQYLDNISINKNIVESDLLNYFSTLTFDEDSLSILFSCDDFNIAVFDALGESNPEAMLLLYVSVTTDDMYCLYISNRLYNELSSFPNNEIFSTYFVLNAGWNNSNYFNLIVDSDSYTYNETINNLPLIFVPPVFVDTLKAEKLSFFDITLLQTDNTFKKFQLPFLRNAFESVFNILDFESSYVSSFVLTSFTWMIQLLLLHVVVDTLAFIFKMYHKLMDKVV